MDRKAIEEKVLECVSIAYHKDVSALSLDTCFSEDLSGASILMVGLVSLIENNLDVLIPLPTVGTAKTIGDLVGMVESLA